MSTNENGKTYNFCIKVRVDSQNNESIIAKLEEFIAQQSSEWTIKEITDSTFDGLNTDSTFNGLNTDSTFNGLKDVFWNYRSPATTTLLLEDDGILRAASNAETKPVKDIVGDLNEYAKTDKYKSSLAEDAAFFFPFCTEGNKVFAKKLADFISASNPETVTLSTDTDGNGCSMEIAFPKGVDASYVDNLCKDVAWNNKGNNVAQHFRDLIRKEGNKDEPSPQICSYEAAEKKLTISWKKRTK